MRHFNVRTLQMRNHRRKFGIYKGPRENKVKSEWHIHAFNIHDDVRYIVLKGKSFGLQTNKDHSWDEMIEYGEKADCRSERTRSIPLSVKYFFLSALYDSTHVSYMQLRFNKI
jgi:hypothetical protein